MTDEGTDTTPANADTTSTNTSKTPAITRRGALTAGAALGGLALGGVSVLGQSDEQQEQYTYRVTVADLTSGQPFTPPAVAVHESSVEVFSVGDPANEPVQEIAENGNLEPLTTLIANTAEVRAAAVGESPLVPKRDPGETGLPYYTTLELTAESSAGWLTFLSMLIGTNDGFVGLDTVPLPDELNESYTYYANGYDAGTEQNTELFEDMVPAAQSLILGTEGGGTTESDPEIAEDDVIRPHPGITGDGDLPAEVYDWDEPAGLVQVERIETPTPETPTETPGNETVTGTPGNETVTGTPGNETVTGTPGNETVTGTPGNETVTGTPTETATGTPTETAANETATETES
jgi:hypothetical protein